MTTPDAPAPAPADQDQDHQDLDRPTVYTVYTSESGPDTTDQRQTEGEPNDDDTPTTD